jgi:hypothetical protein
LLPDTVQVNVFGADFKFEGCEDFATFMAPNATCITIPYVPYKKRRSRREEDRDEDEYGEADEANRE